MHTLCLREGIRCKVLIQVQDSDINAMRMNLSVKVLMRAYHERSRTRRRWGKQLAENSGETLAVVPVKKPRVARMIVEIP